MNAEALMKLPEASTTQNPSSHDNIYKKMYSCANRPLNEKHFSNYTGLILVMFIIIGLIIYKKKARFTRKNSVKTFLQNHDIVKLIIGLLLLNHVRELSNSMVHNLIHPLIDPLIPFIQCTFSIKYLDSHIEIGNFITDILIFSINVAILYILYLILIS
jgi:hypothetical protein